MMKLTQYCSAAIVALTFAGSSIQASDNLPQTTADWQDGYSNTYPAYNSGFSQPGNGSLGYGQYGQWSPGMSSPYGNSTYSPYGGAYGAGSNPNLSGGFYRGPGRHGCHHGGCRPYPFSGYGGNSTPPLPGYVNPGWGATPNGTTYGSPYGFGAGPSFAPGSAPVYQTPGSSFGPATNFSSPSYSGQGYPSQPGGPSYPSYNQVPNSYNQQPNLYNQQLNSYSQPLNSFGAPPQSFSQPGSNYGQPNSNYAPNYGQQGPMLGQPQSSPFYP